MNIENHAVFAAQVCERFLSARSVNVMSSLAAARQALAAENYELLEKENREKGTSPEVGCVLIELEPDELL